jgi:hypothetical protein
MDSGMSAHCQDLEGRVQDPFIGLGMAIYYYVQYILRH